MTEETAPEIKILKLSDPTWVGYLADNIRDYCEKVKIPTIRYETLYTYLTQVVQYGGKQSELWIAHNGDDFKPIAFANWYVKPLPNVGASEIGYIYSWNRARVPVQLLLDQFLQFSYDNNCKVYIGNIINDAVWKVFDKAAEERGIKLTKTGNINFYGVRV